MGAFIFVSVLILIVCVLLTLVVLVQNSKGGGLASNFSSSNQIMGVRKTTDFLEKATWTLAVALLVLSMVSIFVIPRSTGTTTTKSSELQNKAQEAPAGASSMAPTGTN
jgi:preprotein translocase subunit SecG